MLLMLGSEELMFFYSSGWTATEVQSCGGIVSLSF